MKINYSFNDPTLLEQALTHPSFSKENRQSSFERLEFFGDKVLSMVIAQLLWDKHPNSSEAELSVMHSNLVNTKCIAEVASKINLGNVIKMDAGEEQNKGRTNAKILENAMEAVIGAICLDSDFNTTAKLIESLWRDHIEDVEKTLERDSKSILQEWAQKKGKPIPVYKVVNEEGGAHNPIFTIEVLVEGLKSATAIGSSKKIAQQAAAKKLLSNLTNE